MTRKTHNFWGDPDDVEPLPDWMNPETYRNPRVKLRSQKTLEQVIEETLRKPPMIQEGQQIIFKENE